MRQYIYINESGEIGLSDTAPTDTDYMMIGSGMLAVIEIDADGDGLDGGDVWPTVLGVDKDRTLYDLDEVKVDEFEGDTFHVVNPYP